MISASSRRLVTAARDLLVDDLIAVGYPGRAGITAHPENTCR
jgi:hypothetical protein